MQGKKGTLDSKVFGKGGKPTHKTQMLRDYFLFLGIKNIELIVGERSTSIYFF